MHSIITEPAGGMLRWCVVLFVLQNQVSAGKITTAENVLLNELLEDYDTNARPVYDATKAVNVTIDLALNQIIDLSERTEVVVSSIWLRLYWTDEILRWDPADYQNVTTINIFPSRIWKPDVTLYNRVGDDFVDKELIYPASATHDGSVTMLIPVISRSSCQLDITFFPFDYQVCDMTYGSWGHDGTRLDLFPKGPTGDTSVFIVNGQWILESLPTRRLVDNYQCCPEPYPTVVFQYRLKRKPLYYIINLVVPSIMLSLTSLASFLSPPESGEKISLSMTVLLALTVFLLLVADIMPAQSDVFPLIGVFFMMQILLLVMATTTTVVVVRLHHKCYLSGRPPQWLQNYVFKYLAPLVLMKSYIKNHPEISRRKRKHTDGVEGVTSVTVSCQENGTIDEDTVTSGSTETSPQLRGTMDAPEEKKRQDAENCGPEQAQKEWILIATVLDMFFFMVYLLFLFIFTLYILSVAPRTSKKLAML